MKYEELYERAEAIPLERVVGSFTELRRNGSSLSGRCPFHHGKGYTSFSVSPQKNIFRCFKCGVSGVGPVSFYMKYYGIDRYTEAAYRVALDFGAIAPGDFDIGGASFERRPPKKIVLPEKERNERASDEVCNAVYRALSEVFPLTAEHERHLREERRVPDVSGFFSYPDRDAPWGSVAGKVMDVSGVSAGELIHVPGFYADPGGVRMCAYLGRGIGIPVADDSGIVKGVQIRRDNPGGKSRYVWLSSSSMEGREGITGGAGSGAPAGYIEPAAPVDPQALVITEGRFKAEALAAAGHRAIYVAGVSSWKSAIGMMKRTKGSRPLLLAFDADLFCKTEVAGQLFSMADYLRDILKEDPLVLLWSPRYGKGFDDLMHSNERYQERLRIVPCREFRQRYEAAARRSGASMMDELMAVYGLEE